MTRRRERAAMWMIVTFIVTVVAALVAAMTNAQNVPSRISSGVEPVPHKLVVGGSSPSFGTKGEFDAFFLAVQEELVQRLQRAFVAEADFDAPRDHAAIAHVLQRRADAQGRTLDELTRQYVSVFKVAVAGKPRTKWVRGLTTACEKPDGWPSKERRWSRTACLNVVARARAFLSGDLLDPCAGHADHWGGSMDVARARRAGWRVVDCGRTHNTFWGTR